MPYQRLIHLRLVQFVSLLLSCLSLSCSPTAPPSEADQRALTVVQESVKQQLRLELEDELYVRARLLSNASVTSGELDRVYRGFFFHPDGRRRTTEYVYLNVYDSEGKFIIQLAYDPRVDKLIRSSTERY